MGRWPSLWVGAVALQPQGLEEAGLPVALPRSCTAFLPPVPGWARWEPD